MFIIIALLALTALVLLLVVASVWSGRVAARALGLREFRWFDAGPRDDAGKRFVVRAVSSLSGLVVAIVLAILAHLVEGKSTPTLEIKVRQGAPAAAAGLRDGDRMVAVAGTQVSTGDEVRSLLSTPGDVKSVEVERGGERHSFDVRPESGRIGVEFVQKSEPYSVPAAIAGGFSMPLEVWAAVASMVGGGSDLELAGPVGIVRSVGAQSSGLKHLTRVLAMLASLYWPLLAGVHLYAALTRRLFERSYPGTADGQRSATLFRLHQALLLSLMCLAIAFLAHLAMDVAALHPAGLVILLLAPATVSVYPLVWTLDQTLAARPSYFRSAVLVLPCVAPFAAIGVILEARKRLREAGFTRGLLFFRP